MDEGREKLSIERGHKWPRDLSRAQHCRTRRERSDKRPAAARTIRTGQCRTLQKQVPEEYNKAEAKMQEIVIDGKRYSDD
ncbi:hypothetical protein MRB53_042234 [Persea americana]|nr:hypothetical protein MRB53_042234 [Persea americana]